MHLKTDEIRLDSIHKEVTGNFIPVKNDHCSPEIFAYRAKLRAEVIHENRDFILRALNSNSLDADLKRIVLLQEFVRNFAIVLAPIRLFCTTFESVPLAGTDYAVVRYYPLQAAGQSQSYDPSTGYNVAANTTTNSKKVLIGGAGTANSGVNAAANTANDRKYIASQWDSLTLRRQPGFDSLEMTKLNAQRLAIDVWSDVVSRVITAANYGPAVLNVAGSGFGGDNVADLQHQANIANWPTTGGRSMVLDSTLFTSALKDPVFRTVASSGDRKYALQSAYGFDELAVVPTLTSYSPAGENLAGWIAFKSAVLFATAPIIPAPEVRKVMAGYEIVTDEETGITLEFRRQGNAQLDQATQIMQCCYGAICGVSAALKRITSA